MRRVGSTLRALHRPELEKVLQEIERSVEQLRACRRRFKRPSIEATFDVVVRAGDEAQDRVRRMKAGIDQALANLTSALTSAIQYRYLVQELGTACHNVLSARDRLSYLASSKREAQLDVGVSRIATNYKAGRNLQLVLEEAIDELGLHVEEAVRVGRRLKVTGANEGCPDRAGSRSRTDTRSDSNCGRRVGVAGLVGGVDTSHS